ncbi:hypothetical protein ESCOCP352B2_22880 [Escherichia coli]
MVRNEFETLNNLFSASRIALFPVPLLPMNTVLSFSNEIFCGSLYEKLLKPPIVIFFKCMD